MAEKLENKTRVGKHALSLLERAVIKIESDAKALIFYKGHECAASYLKIISTLVETEEIDDRQYESLFSGKKPFFVFQGVLRKEFYIDKEKGYGVRFFLFKKGSEPVHFPQIPCLPYAEDSLSEEGVASICIEHAFICSEYFSID